MSARQRIGTGIDGLDSILDGGLPAYRLFLVSGDPGAGKTTMALQFLIEGAKAGETCLYITLSETKTELQMVAKSHGWDLSGIHQFELSAVDESLKEEAQQSTFHPSEIELQHTTRVLLDEVERIKPTRVVFDSLCELRLLAQHQLRYRRQILSLKNYFSGQQCTVMLLDDRTSERGDLHVESLAHGCIELRQSLPEYGSERRRLRIVKMRGVKYLGGYHDFQIKTGGIAVFPRLTTAGNFEPVNAEIFSSGVAQLDDLMGGGVKRGTSILVMGPAGVGKSTLAMHFSAAALGRNEGATFYSFEEGPSTFFDRAHGVGLDFGKHIHSGKFRIQEVNPAELSPGEFVRNVKDDVERRSVSVVVIDSLNGYLNAMPEERLVAVQLRDLLTYLRKANCVAMMVISQHGMLGSAMQSPIDVSYLADNVLMLRYFEAAGAVYQAIAAIKKRGGSHERTLREFAITSKGIQVGRPLNDFHGILAGVPQFIGKEASLLKDSAWNQRSNEMKRR